MTYRKLLPAVFQAPADHKYRSLPSGAGRGNIYTAFEGMVNEKYYQAKFHLGLIEDHLGIIHTDKKENK